MLLGTSREKELKLFANDYFSLNPYEMEPMQGDAGLRHYYRITSGNKSYVAMDCPPSYAPITPFINIANFLLENSFSAPSIIHHNIEQGFMLLEDFGRTSVKNYLENIGDNGCERRNIYCLIIDLLCELQEKKAPSYLKNFDNNLLCSEIVLFTSWYIPYIYERDVTLEEFNEFREIWQNILAKQVEMPSCIVLRDFHLENMMYLSERNHCQKIGLLDFQDALLGSPIYDLVSLLEDARFDVNIDDAMHLIDYFTQKKQYDKESVLTNYHILGAQRNLRILGVFARKHIRDKDDGYLKYIPRVKKYLENDLSHPYLKTIKDWLKNLK